MIEDVFVINAVAHAWNLSKENIRPPYGQAFADLLWGDHINWNPAGYTVPREVFMTDWPMEAVAKSLFLESRTDMAVNHYLRLESWFYDGLCSRAKNVEAAMRWPNRFFTYAGVDPTQGLEVCLRDLEEQMAELPGSVGLKLYPDQVNPYRTWRMDDESLSYPLFERAQELGIRVIGIHKVLTNGPVPMNPYKVDDIDGPAIHFPDLNFEIIHAGLAFAEETAHAIARFPNVYANLEITASLLHRGPEWFKELLAFFIFWAGPQKIIFSDGTMFSHTEPLLTKFWELELSDHVMNKYGLEQITKDDKALILGGNFARIVGLDIEEAKAKIKDDEFSLAQRERGLDPPYSNWLSMAGADVKSR